MKTYKGKYIPKNPNKYKGDHTNIIYRSSWELKFMKYCDARKSIIEWSSEEIIIPYRSPLDGRIHRYFVDFYIKSIDMNNNITNYLVEVKPKNKINPPIKNSQNSKKYLYEVYEYLKNQAKWNAAKEYCKDKKMEFIIITEDNLGIK